MISMAEVRRYKMSLQTQPREKLLNLLDLLEELEKSPGLSDPQRDVQKAIKEELERRKE